ncbi:MAG: ATP synthase F1 subunit delta [Planctomycetota bacterium]|jgi:F-type H+-transporting ATPase subunit delta
MSDQAKKIPTVFDSEEQHVGEVYARALLAAGQNSKSIDSIVDQLESLVVDVLDKNSKVDYALSNPKMSVEDKWGMIDRVFAGKMDPTLVTFLKVLARRQRLGSLRSVQRSASLLRDQMAGRIQVQATVAQELSAAAKDALVENLKKVFKKDVRLTTKVDPSILGGLIVRVGDTVLDGSVDGQLAALRKTVGQRAENALRTVADSLVQSN